MMNNEMKDKVQAKKREIEKVFEELKQLRATKLEEVAEIDRKLIMSRGGYSSLEELEKELR